MSGPETDGDESSTAAADVPVVGPVPLFPAGNGCDADLNSSLHVEPPQCSTASVAGRALTSQTRRGRVVKPPRRLIQDV